MTGGQAKIANFLSRRLVVRPDGLMGNIVIANPVIGHLLGFTVL
jgi:hypothetical protein